MSSELSQAEKAVFGVHAVKDEFGQIIEKGIGFVKQVEAGAEAMVNAGPLIEQRDQLLSENDALKKQVADLAGQIAALHAIIADQRVAVIAKDAPPVTEVAKAADGATAEVAKA